MPERETELLTIGAVAERSGLAHSTLRFYEDHELLTTVRTDGGQRRYHRDTLRRLAVIRAAQHVGFSLAEVAEMLEPFPHDRAMTAAEWRRLSSSWRPQIDDRIRTLERFREQLDRCIGCGCLSMKACAMANPGDRAAGHGPGPRFWLRAASD